MCTRVIVANPTSCHGSQAFSQSKLICNLAQSLLHSSPGEVNGFRVEGGCRLRNGEGCCGPYPNWGVGAFIPENFRHSPNPEICVFLCSLAT